METQIKKLKINAKNIHSYLVESNRTLKKYRKDRKKFDLRQTNIQKQKTKESKIESKQPSIFKKIGKSVGGSMKANTGIFGAIGDILNFVGNIFLANAVENIDNIAGILSKRGISFTSIFGTISKFVETISNWGTNLLKMAVKLPSEQEFNQIISTDTSTSDTSGTTQINNGETTTNNQSNDTNTSTSSTPFTSSNQILSDNLINTFKNLETFDGDMSRLFTSDFSSSIDMSSDPLSNFFIPSEGTDLSSLYNSDLDGESVDQLMIMTQKIFVED